MRTKGKKGQIDPTRRAKPRRDINRILQKQSLSVHNEGKALGVPSYSNLRRGSILKSAERKWDKKRQLWDKLTEIVEKRRVRFSRFVTVTDHLTGKVQINTTESSPSPTKSLEMKDMTGHTNSPRQRFDSPKMTGSGSQNVGLKKQSSLGRTPQRSKDSEVFQKTVKEKTAFATPGLTMATPGLTMATPGMKKMQKRFKQFALPSVKPFQFSDVVEFKTRSVDSKIERHVSDMELVDVDRMDSSLDIQQSSDSALFDTSSNVCGIIESLDVLKKRRARADIEDEMTNIHQRVKDALKSVDMYQEGEDLTEKTRFPPINSLELMKARREKMYQEKSVIEEVNTYKGMCQERSALLAEVDQWMTSKDLLSDLGSEDDLQRMVRYFQEIHSSVMTALHRYSNASETVIDLGKVLLGTVGAIIKENEENAKKLKAKEHERAMVYDERQLLNDTVKWDNGVKLVLNTFEDAIKWTKNNTYKTVYQKGQKQFKELSSAMKKRNNELKEKRRMADDLKMKNQSAKNDMESRIKEIEELRKRIRRVETDMEEKKHLLGKAEERNKTMNQKVVKFEAKIRALEAELLSKPSPPPTPPPSKAPTPPPPEPPPEPQIVKVIDSATQLKLEETEEELEKTKNSMRLLNAEVISLEGKLRLEKDKVRQLKADLEAAEKAAAEAELSVVIPELPRDPLPEQNLDNDRDSAYYKTLLTGMKRDFATELDKLKVHLSKEKQRNNANLKRVENTHKEQLGSIQRDIIRVLRAIMHFRDHVGAIMEKEALKDPSYALSQLGSLIPEKLSPDPRELLTLLVGNVVEYMHNMETVIANAFLTMRMMIKGSITINQHKDIVAKKSETKVKIEEAQKNLVQMENVKVETKNLAVRLQKAKQKLITFEELTEKQETHDRKYLALLERYRLVWKMYNHLQKDMDMLQIDFKDAVEEKLRQREDIIVSQIKMELKDRRKVHEQELKITIADQKENLKILEHAYEENKISKELYNMAASLLHKALEIPRKKLRYMLEQYIAYRTVRETRERVDEILQDEGLTLSVRRDMERYVRQIDDKLKTSMNLWHGRMKGLEDEKKILFKSIWKTFTEVFAESGVLLVHPLLNKSTNDKQELFSKMAGTLAKDTLKKMMQKQQKRVNSLMKLPDVLEGSSALTSPADKTALWNAQYSNSGGDDGSVYRVYTSHLVNYDINREKIKAKGMLSGKDNRCTFPLAQSRNYAIGKEMQLTY